MSAGASQEPASHLSPEVLQRLLQVGSEVVSELDHEAVLQRVLEAARDLTGARYAALGVLDGERRGLERFLTSGIDQPTQRAIGDLPHGRGILGVLITDPKPLRLSDVGAHPASYGFPIDHPPMQSFLGVPVLVRGEAWGNLYLTEKADGEFDEADEAAIVMLARWAATAIHNARLYRNERAQRDELERAVRALETTSAITRAAWCRKRSPTSSSTPGPRGSTSPSPRRRSSWRSRSPTTAWASTRRLPRPASG